MAKGSKRSAPKADAKSTKKTKFQPQPVPALESSSENEATFYQSAEDDSSDASGSDVEMDSAAAPAEESGDELDELDKSSEDELDGGSASSSDSSSDSDSDSDSDSEDGDKAAADPNKKSSSEQHAEQKKLLAERKLKRKAGVEVERIKSLWEKLRVKKPAPPKQYKERLCNEIWELSKDVIYDLVLKHDASRVVQTLVKHTTDERRTLIVKALKGNYYKLATSSYGKYLLVKLLHYGSKESRELIVDELHGKLRKLMRHKEGAYVVEDLYVLYSTPQQRQQMAREFWGSEYAVFKDTGKDKTILDIVNESAEKRQLIMANLSGTIAASVSKGSTGFQILHTAMKDYTTVLTQDIEKNDSQIREFIELLAEQFAELVHTQDGSHVASTLIALANAKERKTIIRSLKSHAKELIKNEYGNSVLITVFMTVDDTVLVHKSFAAELFTPELMPSLIQDKFSRRPPLYLLKGLTGKYFSPKNQKEFANYEALAYQKTSKKPQAQRHAELSERALPLIYKAILSTTSSDSEVMFSQLLSVNIAAQFITELCLLPTESKEINEELRPQLVNAIFDVTFALDILEDFHLLNKTPFFSRTLQALIRGNEYKWNNDAKKLEVLEDSKIASVGSEFAYKVGDTILQNKVLENWTNGQAAYVLLAAHDVLCLLDPKKAKELNKALKKMKKEIALDPDNKGGQALLKTL